MEYQTVICKFDGDVCYVKINRPDANNTINNRLLCEFSSVLNVCQDNAKIIVLEGMPEVFCFGADFQELVAVDDAKPEQADKTPELLYDLWSRLATGPYVTIAHVRGKANAGGVGFAAACDLVIADNSAQFSLSELLFGVMPAYVFPFLVRRVGLQKAHAMTLMTKSIDANEAHSIGLIDFLSGDSQALLRKHMLRLKLLNKTAIKRYKNYINGLYDTLGTSKEKALTANHQVFSDQDNIEKIKRYVNIGRFPWED